MHSSVAEQWIADPRVTGSNPVVPFLFAFGAMSWRIAASMRCARLCFVYRSIAMDAVQQGDKLGDHPKAALAWHYAKTCPFRENVDRISSHLHTTLNKSRDEKLMLAPTVLVSDTGRRYRIKESK